MKLSYLLKLSAAGVALLPGVLLAEAAQAQQANRADTGIESLDIIVTSRRTAESLADIPLAITAFDAEGIEKDGIRDLNDVARLTPGLNFTSVIGEFMPTPIIRGVAQTDLFGSDPNVAIFIDGVYTGAREALNFAQADIERIEVVKGPQSALYGRNAFAGAINIISKRPSDRLSMRGELTLGTNKRITAVGSLSVPVVADVLAVRVTASHSQYDGSHRNLSGGPDLGGFTYNTIQSTVRFTPAPGFEMVGGAYYSDDRISPPAVTGLMPNCEPSAGSNQAWCGELPALADGAGIGSYPGAYGQTRKTLRTFLDTRINVGDWQVGLLTGYNHVDLSALTDATRGIPTSFRYRNFAGQIKEFQTTILRDEGEPKFREFSQEIRLTSPEGERVRGGIGGFFFSGKQTRPNFDGVITDPLPADFLMTFPIPGPWNSFFDGAIFDKTVTRNTKNYAIFGHLEADLATALTLRGELRWSEEKQHTIQPASSIPPISRGIDKHLSFKTWSPRISLQYKPIEALLLYASAARGAKSGGFDLNAPTEHFNPEYNWTYELGTKASWLDGRIMLDLNAYYIDWTNIQIPVLDQTVAPPVAITRNLGDAKSKGFEAQLNLRPLPELTAGFGLAYNDAKYSHALNAGFAKFPSFAPNGDVSGNRLQAAARWQLNGMVDYRIPVSDSLYGFVRADVSYRSKQFMDATNLTVIPEKTLVNLRTGVDADQLRIEFFVENLFDNRKPNFAFRDVFLSNVVNGAPAIFSPRITVSHPRGRELGVRTSFNF